MKCKVAGSKQAVFLQLSQFAILTATIGTSIYYQLDSGKSRKEFLCSNLFVFDVSSRSIPQSL
jgi:hypothetical protein